MHEMEFAWRAFSSTVRKKLLVQRNCIAWHCVALHDTAMHDTAMHDAALHETALHDTALHDMTWQISNLAKKEKKDMGKEERRFACMETIVFLFSFLFCFLSYK